MSIEPVVEAANADEVDVRDRAGQIGARQRMRQPLDVQVPSRSKDVHCGFVNAFEEKDASIVASHGRSLSRS